jgi:hypothetical protein
MISEKNAPRLLGVAFLFVFFASLVSTQMISSVVGSGSMSDMLVSVSGDSALMRLSVLVGLLTSIGIVVLAVMLYVCTRRENEILALVGLGWWLAEAITLAVSKLGALALIPLSSDFVEAGAPEASHFQTLGDFLYSGLLNQGDDIHMLFYSIGGVLWFYLLYRSRLIPRLLSVPGLAIETLGLMGMVLLLGTGDANMLFFYPIALLEVVVGVWLVVKGGARGSGTAPSELPS